MSSVNSYTVFGAFEYVKFPELGVDTVLAKIDTGAYSGALHCSVLKTRTINGKRVLRFKPLGVAAVIETEDFLVTNVRSSTGHREVRYLIDTQIEVKGRSYSIRIGLSNRKNMKKGVLIGRRFLRENDILVDSRINQEFDTDGGETYANSDSI